MKKADKFKEFEKQLTFTWDGNVVKSIAKENLDEFLGETQLIVYASPMDMFKKLRYNPIMLNFMAVCQDFGTLKLPISTCFSEAVLCSDFKTQGLQNEFKFMKDGVENASMTMSFMIEKVSRDSIGDVLKALEESNKFFQKNLRKKLKSRQGEEDDEDELEPCPDFACLSELPEHCKKSLELGEHVYRIVNGHLINIRDKKGICGETCEVAKKYCTEYRKSELPKVSSPIDLLKLFSSKKPPNKIDCEKSSDEDRKFSDNSLNCEKLLKSDDMVKFFEEQMEQIRANMELGCGDGPQVLKEKVKGRKKKLKRAGKKIEER